MCACVSRLAVHGLLPLLNRQQVQALQALPQLASEGEGCAAALAVVQGWLQRGDAGSSSSAGLDPAPTLGSSWCSSSSAGLGPSLPSTLKEQLLLAGWLVRCGDAGNLTAWARPAGPYEAALDPQAYFTGEPGSSSTGVPGSSFSSCTGEPGSSTGSSCSSYTGEPGSSYTGEPGSSSSSCSTQLVGAMGPQYRLAVAEVVGSSNGQMLRVHLDRPADVVGSALQRHPQLLRHDRLLLVRLHRDLAPHVVQQVMDRGLSLAGRYIHDYMHTSHLNSSW